jgi:amino acid adenylation domain-containing protein/non-ribosomal peptide synthase protein (TIGR01720 family)
MDIKNIEAVYPLSPIQEAVLSHDVNAAGDATHYGQLSCELKGTLNLSAFEEAWQQVTDRHAALRTSFVWKRVEKPLQLAHKRLKISLETHDWRGMTATEQKERFDALLQADREQGFDLSQAPLSRLTLCQTSEDTYQFVWSYTHLLLDDQSLLSVLKEVFVLYEGLCDSREIQATSSHPYRDYIAWLKPKNVSEAETFWRQALKGFTEPTSLVVNRTLDNTGERAGYDVQTTVLPVATAEGLRSLAQQHQLTLNTLLQGAWALLLNRYTGARDVIFGLAISGRPADLEGAESMVGSFANILPMRAQVGGEERLLGWLKQMQVEQEKLRQYEYSPPNKLQEWSEVLEDQPLFMSVITLDDDTTNQSLEGRFGGLTVSHVQNFGQTNFPLTLKALTSPELTLQITYDRSHFGEGDIAQILNHIQSLLEGMVADPEQQLGQIKMLTPAERHQLLVEWNDTAVEYPHEQCIHQLFEQQVERTPEAIALVFNDEQISYRELNERANQLAHHLRQLGVRPESRVGICVEPSVEMVIGLLGILKAGAAYVPLDAGYPEERLLFMLEDAQVPVLLTQEDKMDELPVHWSQVICLDTDWEQIAQQNTQNLLSDATSDNLAYIIYTSGSTGTPKGVSIPHRAVIRLVSNSNFVQLLPSDKVAQVSNVSFDALTFELWGALLHGAQLIGITKEVALSPHEFATQLAEQGITTMFLTVALFDQVAREAPRAFSTMRHLLVGGDALNPQWVREVMEQGAPERFLNGYGPTESTTFATWHEVREVREGARTVPIGEPLSNTRTYVVDKAGEMVPVGVAGELYIGGDGLARGYWQRAELTAERFVPDALSGEAGGRLYRTGDLARYLEDGNIEYLGRLDHQVKVRGHRIELGEIEATLATHAGVRQCVVVAREEAAGDKRLVAYVVSEGDEALALDGLRSYLREKLPDYMIPSFFVTLDELPLTPNGKIDRRSLPAPDHSRDESEHTFVAPSTPAELALASIWCDVLALPQVGIHDNFFELGGDSIRSIQVRARAQKLGLDFSIPQLFQHQSIHALAQVLTITEPSLAPPSQTLPFDLITEADRLLLPPDIEDAYPLTRLQSGMLFHSLYSPESAIYHDIFSFHLEAPLEVDVLRQAIDRLIGRHPVLRTTFDLTSYSEPLQLVHAKGETRLEVKDISDLDSEEQERQLGEWMEREEGNQIDWREMPLLRFQVYRRSERTLQFTLSFHHVIVDGWSVATMLTELFQNYMAAVEGREREAAEPLASTFRDFVRMEREALESEESERYWVEKMDGASFVRVPRMGVVSEEHSLAPQAAGLDVPISLELSNDLKEVGRQVGVPLKSVLLAAHLRVMSVLSGQGDVTTGIVTNGRAEEADGERVLGLFLNTLPLRVKMRGGTWQELVREVFEAEREQMAHRRYPMVELQKQHGGQPLFETAFNYTHFHVYESLKNIKEVSVLGVSTFEQTNFTLAVNFGMDSSTSKIKLRLDYDASQLSAEQVQTFRNYYTKVLALMTAEPTSSYTSQSLLSEQERHQLLIEWNDTAVEYPHQLCLHQLFEQQVERTPDAIALIFEEAQVSYRELNERANQLAHHLRLLGVGPEGRVGICVERSIEMVVGLLGILKAGGAYVPLDAQYPQERLRFMLEDAEVGVLLTQQHLVEMLPEHAAQVLCLDTDWEQIAQQNIQNPRSGATPDNLAYIIYTSGSTGTPKGVLVQHQGLSNLSKAQAQAFNLQPDNRILQFSSFSFDASVFEIVMGLLTGAVLCMGKSESVLPGIDLIQLLRRLAITNIVMPPSALGAMPYENLPALQTIVVAGEACPSDVLALWSPQHRFFNAYGPTESTIWATVAECGDSDVRPPIGRPIANTQVYLLDTYLQPVPIGVAGELHIGGDGLARGYWQRAELTAERFIPDAMSGQMGGRLYRTGDLARYLPDGNIEYLGRIDHQVKVRGHRIELGEIEAVLATHTGVRQCVVIAREDTPGIKQLVAYLVSEGEEAVSISELRSYLKEKLPDYMIPSFFVTLDELPLTPNGKIDRRSLPAPERTGAESEHSFVAATTAEEQALAVIWCEVLNLPRVGIHDNFFHLGGDSILSIQVIARANDAGLRLTPKQLFQHPTISELALLAGSSSLVLAEQGFVSGHLPLTPIQHWFFDQQLPRPHHFNQALLLETRTPLDATLLASALQHLLEHHDALRMRFTPSEAGWLQLNLPPDDLVPLSFIDLSAVPAEAVAERIEAEATLLQSSLNLSDGPLLRVALFDLGKGRDGRLLIVIHHLVVDGVSWRILLEDLQTAYQQLAQGEEIKLPAKTTSFKRWAELLTEYAASESIGEERAYWEAEGERQRAVRALPVDYEGGSNSEALARAVTVSLSEEQTRALLQEVPEAYHTQINDVLLTALVEAFGRWSGERRLVVDLEGHGREEIGEEVDVSRTVGWFTTMYPVRLEIKGGSSLGEGLKGVKEQLRGVPRRGLGYGLVRYVRGAAAGAGGEEAAERAEAEQWSGGAEAQVSFNYLGQFDQLFTERSAWVVAEESSGAAHDVGGERGHLIDVSGMITGGRLQVTWAYSEGVYRRETIEAVAQGYVEALEELIAHCRSAEAGGFTPSDFPLAKLNETELDNLLQNVEF